MGNIEIIAQLVPKNNANLAIADVNHLKGGFIQVSNKSELLNTLQYSNRLKEGMLAFVSGELKFYQLLNGEWSIWRPEAGASLVLQSVEKESDLFGTTLETKGQVVFVEELDALRYYTGTKWAAFSRIYVQPTPPSDLTGIWIDTSDTGLNESSSVASELYKMVNILARRVAQLEYMNQQIQSGGFDNNMYDLYGNIIGVDPGDEIAGITDEETSDGTNEEQDYSEEQLLLNTLLADSKEPLEYKDTLPNVRHIQIKWGTYNDMMKYKDNFLPAELLFCHNINELYIKHPKTYQLIKIGATISGGGDQPDIEDIMNGIIQSGDYIGSISFVDMVNPNRHWTFGVSNGELSLYNEELNVEPVSNNQAPAADAGFYKGPYIPTAQNDYINVNSLLHINMIYSGGNTYNKYNPCNYNFIEISNLTQYDINLRGFYLHYSEGPAISTRKWISLPLKGVIKGNSTYLIKGAKCGDDTFARIKVGAPDIYFSKGITYNPDIFDTSLYSIWDSEGMLKINNNCAFFLSGPVYATVDSDKMSDYQYTEQQLKTAPYAANMPWRNDASNGVEMVRGYCDMAGFGKDSNNTAMPAVLTAAAALNPDFINVVYYSMDNVSQAYKAITSASTTTTAKVWTSVNIKNPHAAIDVEKYTPKNSKEGKNIFYNKHLLEDNIPTFVTCTMGYNPHTTRAFTWVSKGYRDEFLRYRKQGELNWEILESYKSGDGRPAFRNREKALYNRIRSVTTDGTYFTTHKCFVDFYEPDSNGPENTEIWEYQVGWENHWTDIRTFTLRNRQTIIDSGFQFLQVTDQQGFNQEEYEEWRCVAESINKNYCNAYTYEVGGDINSAELITKLPTPNVSAKSLVFVLDKYYEKKSTTTRVYQYVKKDEAIPVLGTVLELPAATETSPEAIKVGNLYQLIDGEYKDINEFEEGFMWPSSYDEVAELPEVTDGASEFVFVLVGYYEKELKSETTEYSYEEMSTVPDLFVKELKVPKATETSAPIIAVGTVYTKVYNNIEFTVNTGDATQNGNRINEWVDYFKAGNSLFTHLEQQYSVGNNDLCPIMPYELGKGTDTTKQNPININYFFTYEHPYEIPMSNPAEGEPVYVPCVYSFIYGNTYFLCMNSELTDSGEACNALFGQQGGPLYQTLKGWAERDLENAGEVNWKIAFCHESPFTILIKAVMDTYKNKVVDNPDYVQNHRGDVTSHFNSPGGFWFSKFLEDNAFHLCICGHKHTYATCRYLNDNPENRMKPFVYDPAGKNASFINNDNKYFMEVTDAVHRHYVKYTMCQASGYKLVSNKELPYQNIGWIEEYYPTDGSNKVNGQLFPHYIIWNVGKGTEVENPNETTTERERIVGKARKVYPKGYALSAGHNKLYNYNSLTFNGKEMQITGGNGSTNPNNNIIVEKLPYVNPVYHTLEWTGDITKVTGGTETGTYLKNTLIDYPLPKEGYTVQFEPAPVTITEDTVINITVTVIPPTVEEEEGE